MEKPGLVAVRPQPYSVLLPLAPWEPPEIVASALDSLACQTWPPSQLVVSVDGVLPEALQVVLERYPLSLISMEGPGGEGVGPVLNRGLRHCLHEWVVRADADDLSCPQRCEIQLSHLFRDPELVVVGSVISEFIDDPAQPIALRDVPLSWKGIDRLSRWRNPMNHPSVVWVVFSILAQHSEAIERSLSSMSAAHATSTMPKAAPESNAWAHARTATATSDLC